MEDYRNVTQFTAVVRHFPEPDHAHPYLRWFPGPAAYCPGHLPGLESKAMIWGFNGGKT
jgi:hypothetical protein